MGDPHTWNSTNHLFLGNPIPLPVSASKINHSHWYFTLPWSLSSQIGIFLCSNETVYCNYHYCSGPHSPELLRSQNTELERISKELFKLASAHSVHLENRNPCQLAKYFNLSQYYLCNLITKPCYDLHFCGPLPDLPKLQIPYST